MRLQLRVAPTRVLAHVAAAKEKILPFHLQPLAFLPGHLVDQEKQPSNLAAKLAEVNGEKRLCRVTPGATAVTKWIEQARSLGTAIRY
jgi:hypothetical protein